MRSARGIYRGQTSDGRARFACVIYAGSAGSEGVPEAHYRDWGYQPPFDELPTKEEYETKKVGSSKKGPKTTKASATKPKRSKRVAKGRQP